MTKIAIVGGGPKAVAISAKASTIKSAPEIVVFEPHEIGANWSGRFAYTDGGMLLCTSPFRDIGFPYKDKKGSTIDAKMIEKFSWLSFLNSSASSTPYDVWISKGMPPPSHSDYAQYLKWCFAAAARDNDGITHLKRACTSFDYSQDEAKWIVEHQAPGDATKEKHLFDAVVFTGSKERDDKLCSAETRRYFFGTNFWEKEHYDELMQSIRCEMRKSGDYSVTIIGDGGTAAAVAANLASLGFATLNVNIVGSNPFIDSRPENHFVDIFYSNPENWLELTVDQRTEFLKKVERGRVWKVIVDQLKDFEQIRYISAKVGEVKLKEYEDGLETFEFYDESGEKIRDADSYVVIDARGFDALWFLDMLRSELRSSFASDKRDVAAEVRTALRSDLSVGPLESGKATPVGLHIPMLGSLTHLAAPNLMALGSVADAILEPYRID